MDRYDKGERSNAFLLKMASGKALELYKEELETKCPDAYNGLQGFSNFLSFSSAYSFTMKCDVILLWSFAKPISYFTLKIQTCGAWRGSQGGWSIKLVHSRMQVILLLQDRFYSTKLHKDYNCLGYRQKKLLVNILSKAFRAICEPGFNVFCDYFCLWLSDECRKHTLH